jgi:hypothetical protein
MNFCGLQKYIRNGTIRWFLICFILAGVFSCDGGRKKQIASNAEGFTFFDMGANTELSEMVQWQLDSKLGSGVSEKWTTADLSINYKGFLQEYFPQFHELNIKMKSDDVLRTEDNPIKLTYRHIRGKDAPFVYVELIFSGYTKKPLFFKIKTKKEGTEVIDALEKKYGDPRIIDWDEKVAYGKKGRSLCWQHRKDMLIASIIPDRFDQPEYYIMIYYTENIEENLRINKEKKERKKQKADTVKNAF